MLHLFLGNLGERLDEVGQLRVAHDGADGVGCGFLLAPGVVQISEMLDSTNLTHRGSVGNRAEYGRFCARLGGDSDEAACGNQWPSSPRRHTPPASAEGKMRSHTVSKALGIPLYVFMTMNPPGSSRSATVAHRLRLSSRRHFCPLGPRPRSGDRAQCLCRCCRGAVHVGQI